MTVTPADKKIQLMKLGGRKLALILQQLEKMAKPGINLLQIERKAWMLIEKAGGYPSFAKVPGYHHATCLNLNNGLVHGIPFDYILKKGDLLNIDIGFFYNGYHTDCAKSFLVDSRDKEISLFLKTGQQALENAISSAVVGNRVSDISRAIQDHVESHGYYCSRNYTGHGISKDLHEPPSIPCFLDTNLEKDPLLSYNMTIAIEVIYMLKKTETKVSKDGWSVKTNNNCPAACFEKTICVRDKKAIILTPW